MKRTLLFLFISIGLQTAHAQVEAPIQNKQCDFFESKGLKTIMVPLDHTGLITKRLLAYSYQILNNNAGETKPKTLVYLTGGPGGGVIGNSEVLLFRKLLNLGFNLILIDPRGVACNSLNYGEVPDEVISTEQTAFDVIEVIKAEALDDYIIMGHSYGTMLGTVLTSKINQMDEMPQPELLVLDGTFGRHLKYGLEYNENLVKVFYEEMPKYFPAVRDIFFSGEDLELPFGYPLDYWTSALISFASLGVETFEQVNPQVVALLDGYPESLSDESLREHFARDFMFYETFSFSDNPVTESEILNSISFNYVYYSIMCKEMSPQDVSLGTLEMVDGALSVGKGEGADICSAFDFSDKPYDSRDYELQTPTLYFQGTSDGQTPLEYLYYHYANNVKAAKVVVEVVGGGHGLFFTDLEACTSQIWTEIKKGSHDFSNILDQDGYCMRPDSL